MYTITIGLAALLLFLVQPLMTKVLLPGFGGGASIWVTSLVFYQGALLAGYGATHVLIRRLRVQSHMALHVALMLLSLTVLPIAVDAGDIDQSSVPAVALILLLAATVGLPYFILATTSPLVQHWIAVDRNRSTVNPYVQYAVSNAGSMVGLLIYPFLLEPLLGTTTQRWLWTAGYGAFVVAMVTSMCLFIRGNAGDSSARASARADTMQVGARERGRWVYLATVPSAMLVVMTHYLTQDVVNFPLLWVSPLCVYLVTFVICFSVSRATLPSRFRTFAALLSILLLLLSTNPALGLGFVVKVLIGLVALFGTCMVFHGDLERSKPRKEDLTDFYLHVATGGCLGSILVALVFPLVFRSNFEFYLVIVVSLYYIVATSVTLRTGFMWLFRGATLAAVVLSYLLQETRLDPVTKFRARSFYSTYAVRESAAEDRVIRRLVAGTHVHGAQNWDRERMVPISYYHDGTGIASVFRVMADVRDVALVGLGVGGLVAYGREGMVFDAYEIDQTVVDVAKTQFDYLSLTPAGMRYLIGDGRINMRESPPGSYDLIVVDAFTSGSIPLHLITAEAVAEMMVRIRPHGGLAYHISNHHVDLLPVLAGIAEAQALAIGSHVSLGREELHRYPARWVLLTRQPALIEGLRADDSKWREPAGERIYWTDDFSNVWSILR